MNLSRFIFTLHHRQVRDLAWSCFSPSLMHRLAGLNARPYEGVFNAQARHWLTRLDNNPEPLLTHLAQRKGTRLGLYFEALWHFYWRAFGDEHIVLHNTQVSEGGKTLGAFDFIVKKPDAGYLHIECAVKFYLGTDDLGSENNWIGPNGNDRLGRKLEHLRTHQLRLSERPAAQSVLSCAGINPRDIERRFLLRGYFFYPGEKVPTCAHEGNIACGQHPWWYAGQLLRQASDKTDTSAQRYSVLPRNTWLAPAVFARALEPLNYGQLCRVIQSLSCGAGRPLMVAKLVLDNNRWCEASRFMVVPDYWPRMATPSRNT